MCVCVCVCVCMCVCVYKLKVSTISGGKGSLFRSLGVHPWKRSMGAFCGYSILGEEITVVPTVVGSELKE